jgi:hypothetical protein
MHSRTFHASHVTYFWVWWREQIFNFLTVQFSPSYCRFLLSHFKYPPSCENLKFNILNLCPSLCVWDHVSHTYRVILSSDNPVLGMFRQNCSSPLIYDIRILFKKATLYKLKGKITILYIFFFPLAPFLGSSFPYWSTGLTTQFLDLSQAVGLLGRVITLPKHRKTRTHIKHTCPGRRFEPAITASEWSNTIHASDRSATATGTILYSNIFILFVGYLMTLSVPGP